MVENGTRNLRRVLSEYKRHLQRKVHQIYFWCITETLIPKLCGSFRSNKHFECFRLQKTLAKRILFKHFKSCINVHVYQKALKVSGVCNVTHRSNTGLSGLLHEGFYWHSLCIILKHFQCLLFCVFSRPDVIWFSPWQINSSFNDTCSMKWFWNVLSFLLSAQKGFIVTFRKSEKEMVAEVISW